MQATIWDKRFYNYSNSTPERLQSKLREKPKTEARILALIDGIVNSKNLFQKELSKDIPNFFYALKKVFFFDNRIENFKRSEALEKILIRAIGNNNEDMKFLVECQSELTTLEVHNLYVCREEDALIGYIRNNKLYSGKELKNAIDKSCGKVVKEILKANPELINRELIITLLKAKLDYQEVVIHYLKEQFKINNDFFNFEIFMSEAIQHGKREVVQCIKKWTTLELYGDRCYNQFDLALKFDASIAALFQKNVKGIHLTEISSALIQNETVFEKFYDDNPAFFKRICLEWIAKCPFLENIIEDYYFLLHFLQYISQLKKDQAPELEYMPCVIAKAHSTKPDSKKRNTAPLLSFFEKHIILKNAVRSLITAISIRNIAVISILLRKFKKELVQESLNLKLQDPTRDLLRNLLHVEGVLPTLFSHFSIEELVEIEFMNPKSSKCTILYGLIKEHDHLQLKQYLEFLSKKNYDIVPAWAFHKACFLSSWEVVHVLLEHKPGLIESLNSSNETILVPAVQAKDKRMLVNIKERLEESQLKIFLHQENADGFTVLARAIAAGKYENAQLLIKWGAKFESAGKWLHKGLSELYNLIADQISSKDAQIWFENIITYDKTHGNRQFNDKELALLLNLIKKGADYSYLCDSAIAGPYLEIILKADPSLIKVFTQQKRDFKNLNLMFLLDYPQHVDGEFVLIEKNRKITFGVNIQIISQRSAFFKAGLATNFLESDRKSLVLNTNDYPALDFNISNVESLLKFIYSLDIDQISESNVQFMSQAALFFQIDSLLDALKTWVNQNEHQRYYAEALNLPYKRKKTA